MCINNHDMVEHKHSMVVQSFFPLARPPSWFSGTGHWGKVDIVAPVWGKVDIVALVWGKVDVVAPVWGKVDVVALV